MSTPPLDDVPASAPATNGTTVRILKELGEVLVPVSLVALVAQVFSASARTTAILSLLVIALLYTWLYRRWLNNRVKSALIIGIAVVAAAVALLLPPGSGWRGGELSSAGIVAYGERANDWALPKIPEYAKDAKREVWYAGVDFHISASQHQDMLLKLLGQGVSVRFLLYDFLNTNGDGLNPNFPELVKRFDYESPQLLADLTSTVENLRKLQSRWVNKPSGAQLEIRVYKALPWARAYFFDPAQESGRAILINYVYGKDTSNLPAFVLRNEAHGLMPHYYSGMSILWQDATPLDAWLPAYEVYKATTKPQVPANAH